MQSLSELYAVDKIIAIDPGANGGIVIYAPNEDIQVMKMTKTAKEFSNILKEQKRITPNLLVMIEKVSHWTGDDKEGGKKFGIAKLMKNFDQLMAAIEINDCACIQVHPITWQNGLNFKNTGDDKAVRKKFYKNWIAKKLPGVKATLWSADALCICEFAKFQWRYNKPWILQNIPQNMLHNISIVDA